ncbi:MAG: hypothetical protein KME50_25910 [Nostoc desertorum CM1-VF14]|jgi:predicted DNA-binding protein YlxM (UPF0122 family)|nr:hypothetical protein [Nostoc desertorum CM1-VF14]
MTTFLVKDTSITPPQVVSKQVTLAQLHNDVTALAEYYQKLCEYKKQQQWRNLQDKVVYGFQELASLSEVINALSTQLETEIQKFHKIASETNKAYCAIHQAPEMMNGEKVKLSSWQHLSIWQVHHSSIPVVIKEKGKFVLTEKKLDFSNPEMKKDVPRQAKVAQQRRKTLESWLEQQRKS